MIITDAGGALASFSGMIVSTLSGRDCEITGGLYFEFTGELYCELTGVYPCEHPVKISRIHRTPIVIFLIIKTPLTIPYYKLEMSIFAQQYSMSRNYNNCKLQRDKDDTNYTYSKRLYLDSHSQDILMDLLQAYGTKSNFRAAP